MVGVMLGMLNIKLFYSILYKNEYISVQNLKIL